MGQLIGPAFGNGSDGVYTVSTATTDAPIDYSCSGSSGSTSLTATNASFVAGQRILVHQSRGTGVGQWELNTIASYVTGTITTANALSHTYTDSGASQAQVLVMKQYSAVNITDTLTGKAWNGDKGGIVAFFCSGTTTISGSIVGTGKGFRGGAASTGGTLSKGWSGEGSTAASLRQKSNNTNGGGGGDEVDYNAACGGGLGTAGTSLSEGRIGGIAVGEETNASFIFGGGGGGGAAGSGGTDHSNAGGIGGGLVLIISNKVTISGSIITGGNNGQSGAYIGGGGGGAGGGVLIKSQATTLGTTKITAPAGAGGVSTNGNSNQMYGSAGGVGRIRIESCSTTGTTTPTASLSTGGHSYCGGSAFLI